MASGITHMLLMKNLPNELPDNDLKMIVSSGIHFLQVGAVAPDLPYASIADNDFFLTTQSELADKFHYELTNEVPLRAINEIKAQKSVLTPKELRYIFCYFLGYISHLIADGIIHPFVRDKVGDYKENQSAHRVLEMQLDTLYFYHLTLRTNSPIQLNYSNIHDELININETTYPETRVVINRFSKLIRDVYGMDCPVEMILGWIGGLHRMFGVAEGDHPAIYRNIGFINDFLFSNYQELISKYDLILSLDKTTKDGRAQNFLKVDRVHFFDDIIPHYYKTFIPVAQRAYDFIYNDGLPLTVNDIAPIDLDTGRMIANNNLDIIPKYWS
jgi:hypothetical protein